MNLSLHKHWKIRPDIERALTHQHPVVALETAVLTHGLPYPINLQLVQEMETIVRQENALPATIGILDGKMVIGLNEDQLATLATDLNGGTTVGASIVAATKAGLRVFATGGIGGVHREPPFDVSADLIALHSVPMIVVCSGAKSILNLPATLEVLESYGIPVLGYQTDEFPAFYAGSSGLKVTARVDSVKVIAEIAREQWLSGLRNSILVVQPPPADSAMRAEEMEEIIAQAVAMATQNNIQGSNLTPYLLNKVNELSQGQSMKANLALLKNNARLAAQIACEYHPSDAGVA
jgi:pseudouridine-5'-phosphate glycosidase